MKKIIAIYVYIAMISALQCYASGNDAYNQQVLFMQQEDERESDEVCENDVRNALKCFGADENKHCESPFPGSLSSINASNMLCVSGEMAWVINNYFPHLESSDEKFSDFVARMRKFPHEALYNQAVPTYLRASDAQCIAITLKSARQLLQYSKPIRNALAALRKKK